jgi:hypothetical protein
VFDDTGESNGVGLPNIVSSPKTKLIGESVGVTASVVDFGEAMGVGVLVLVGVGVGVDDGGEVFKI